MKAMNIAGQLLKGKIAYSKGDKDILFEINLL